MRLGRWSWLVLLSVAGMAQAALNEARVVSATTALESMLPPAVTLTITTAGSYTLTLADVQGQSGPGAAFSSLSVVISQGAQLSRLLKLPAGQFTTTSPAFTMAAGQYQVQVLGVTSTASQYGFDLKNSSNVSVFSDSGSITAPPTNNFSSVQQALSLTAGQSYTVTLTDRLFPVALSNLQSVVTQGSNLVCPLVAAGTTATCTFTASGGSNLLTILASEVANSGGLYSVKVANTVSGAVAYEAALPLGNLPTPVSVSLPANDAYTLSSIDFLNPAPLSSFKLALLQGANLLVNQSTTGGPAAFTGTTGAASLYVIPKAATGSAGSYSVLIRRGTTTVFSKVDSVADTPSSGASGYVFKVTLPAAGNYALQLRDFVAPQAFTTLSASASQDGVLIGTPLAAPGTLTINNAAAGELTIAVLATPATVVAPALPAGLFGLNLTASGSTTPIFEKTQGVGGSFTSQVFTAVPNARYALTATDFAAPVALDQLRIVVTRGAQQVATVFGGGTLQLDATAGDYTLSFLTTAKVSPGYGMYGVSFSGVALSSSANSVTSSGSVTLTWNADASGCVASGGWTGNKAISGSSSVTVTADTTFTLTCDGAAKSVTVTATPAPAPASTKSGGGSISLGLWLALASLFGVRRLHLAR
jgi:hypothetical protein